MEQTKEMLELIQILVNIDSGSGYVKGINEVGTHLSHLYEDLGFVSTVYENDKVGNGIALKHKEAHHPRILLLLHMDTVFKTGTAIERPFSIEGNYAYGPGVIDMKSSHALVYHAIKDLIESDNDSYKNIEILLTPDEEIGTYTSREWIEKHAKGKDYALVMEPARRDGSMVNQRRGSGMFRIEAFGRAAHAGNNPENGINAIEKIAHLVTKIQKLTNKNEGINVSVGLINGGTSVNTIPNYASIDIDVRTSQLEQAPLIEQKIRDIVEQDESNAAKVLISGGMDRPPMELTNDNLELSNLIIDIAKELGISLKAVSAGGGSDASFTSALGVTTIDGLGPIGGNQHNEDEYLEIDSLKERKKLLEVVISKLSKNVVKQLENI